MRKFSETGLGATLIGVGLGLLALAAVHLLAANIEVSVTPCDCAATE